MGVDGTGGTFARRKGVVGERGVALGAVMEGGGDKRDEGLYASLPVLWDGEG